MLQIHSLILDQQLTSSLRWGYQRLLVRNVFRQFGKGRWRPGSRLFARQRSLQEGLGDFMLDKLESLMYLRDQVS
jgi:hypothetical protein